MKTLKYKNITVLFILVVLVGVMTSFAQVSPEERQALVALYNATDGDNWTNKTNWLSDKPVDDWYGVTVKNNAVTRLYLYKNNLNGEIHSSIGDLRALELLNFENNNLTSVIPSEIGNLTSLKTLNLRNNKLTGIIPLEIGNLNSLTSLELDRNRLEGSIPATLGNLSSLDHLLLYSNRLTGGIPSELGGLSLLRGLNLSRNKLKGLMPPEIASLNIASFIISNNAFVFSDIENEHETLTEDIITYQYTPQAKVDETETLSVTIDGAIPLSSAALTSPNNRYQWYKDGVAIAGATSKEYIITDAKATDAGVYYFTATNTIVDRLELERNKITLVIEPATSLTQKYCNTDNPIFIRDLTSPFSGEANWSFTETEAFILSPDYEITSTATLWAESIDTPSEPRVAVQIIINEEIPTASQTTQYFLETSNPVINNIIIDGTDILWFDSVTSTTSLSGNFPLIHNTYYYAEQNGKGCRLKILVNIIPSNPDPECNLLEEYVNGSFEDCSGQASWYGHNNNVTCGNWNNGRGSADTWNIPFEAHSGISNNIPDSPNGGVVAGAIARSGSYNELESFYTSLENLEIGSQYTVTFYQSNATGTFTSNGGLLARGRWKVLFGDQKLFSSYMLVTNTPVWEEASLEFTATTSNIRLEFVASSASIAGSAPYVYMLIDGISLTKVGGTSEDCPQEVTYEEQKFCTMNEFPAVADLAAPGGASDVSWYSQEIGGYQFNSDTPLGIGNANTYVEVYWADSPDYTSRVPVKVSIDEGAPIGDSFQVFMIQDNPNVGDLQAEGISVQWYDSSTGTVPLSTDTMLVDGEEYYAANMGVVCRLKVEVKITNAPALANSWQAFCSSSSPTISTIRIQASNNSFEIKWFSESEGGLPLSPSTPLQNNTLYYAAQFSGGTEVSDRISVFVVLIQSPPPSGPAQQVFESDESATVGDLIAFGNTIRWFDGNDLELSNDLPLENGGIYYAKQTSFSGGCLSDNGLAVQVLIRPQEPSVYVDCEKFRPEPGQRYVISAWVRENTATVSSTETKNFQEIKPQFLELLNTLKDRIVNQMPTSPIFDPSPEERKYDDILPFINATDTPTNVTVYDLKPYRENQRGINRTVGFSFSLDADGQTEFLYKTPEFSIITYFDRVPLINNDTTVEFDDLSPSSTNGKLMLRSSLRFRSDLIHAIYIVDVDLDISKMIKPSADFNTYVDTSEYQVMNYENSFIQMLYTDSNGNELAEDGTVTFRPQGNIIDGWQRISADFVIPNTAEFMTISLKNDGENINVYYDDIRFQPFDSSMKTFVYDPENLRLQSELDENNYSTFYEYDLEGGLVRVKKETERGIYTIQETRSGSSLLNND